jgi:hypothetical protein
MSIKTKIIHLKIKWFGDKELEKRGKIIPCLKCSKDFLSYCHHSGTYDSYCCECKHDKRDEVKNNGKKI